MRQISILSDKQVSELMDGYKKGEKHHFRIRCQAILLSHEGLSVAQIAFRLNKKKDTIYGWLNNYQSSGIAGLQNASGQGRKALLDSLSIEQIKELEDEVKNEPQNLNKVGSILSKLFGFTTTKYMLIRFLKKN